MLDTLLVTAASALAGLIDAIAGGGGLILVPALFSAYPGAAPATLFGTNKGASVWGTGWATLQYSRQVKLNWDTLRPAALAALVGSGLGAWAVTQLPAEGIRSTVPFVLLVVFIYTLVRRDLGHTHAPLLSAGHERTAAIAIGAVLGFYDGVFGPGTGSFLVFLFVRVLGYDFLHASASAKFINVITNVAAIALFAVTGHVWWGLVLLMAVANVAGSLVGTRLALKHGSGFVRVIFIVVVGALILRTGYDAFWVGR